jgi:diaminopimelate epimerase
MEDTMIAADHPAADDPAVGRSAVGDSAVGYPVPPAPSPGVLTVGKYHGLGNDFLVVLDPATDPDGALARHLCDRHRGIGADGFIVGRTLRPEARDGAVLSFQLFNADGSEAEMSGNGMRCLAHCALDAGLVGVGTPFNVVTPAGRRSVLIHRPGPEIWASVDMGTVKVRGDANRCNVGHGQLLVDVGNPHLVVAGTDPATLDVATLGARLEATDPAGLNVEFVTLGPGPDEVTMRVWERGVGETEACGTGACAAAVAFHHWGRVGPSVTVHQPGGSVAVEIAADESVRLTGPSALVAICVVAVPVVAAPVVAVPVVAGA